jgi:membrane associated rhomboid family serine protease
MVLPIGDDNSDRRRTPWVNYGLIAVNVLVFVLLQQLGTNDDFTYAFSTVPQEIVTGRDEVTEDKELIDPVTKQPVTDPYTGEPVIMPGLRPTPLTPYLTLLTSMFMHGGIAHLLGNMLFLWIFGDNIEDVLGSARYLVFYLICGLVASLSHVAATYALGGDPMTPSLGASGAISGVLGGYLLLFPLRRVTVILFRVLTQVPAWMAIGLWFVFQLVSAFGVLGSGSQVGGVAYGAHIGGFLAGLALIKVFALGLDTDRGETPTRVGFGRSPWREPGRGPLG